MHNVHVAKAQSTLKILGRQEAKRGQMQYLHTGVSHKSIITSCYNQLHVLCSLTFYSCSLSDFAL